jgi:hypothetical protein
MWSSTVYGYQKTQNLMQIPKTNISDKMHLCKDENFIQL